MEATNILERLSEIIEDRKKNPPAKSYVTSLLNGGLDKIGAKITEEAQELLESAATTDQVHTVYETADLLFHVMVLLGYKDIPIQDVFRELERRFGTSGITEKESRKE
jgi:phosphoribosyl-ATP pyrophosphohydrolase